MKQLVNFLLRSSVATFSTGTIWLGSFFAFHQPFLLASAYALGGGGVVYLTIKGMTTHRFLKQNQLTKKEYQYIKKNLNEASKKIRRLRKALLNVRSVASIKQNIEIIRIVNKIYSITKNEPKRFYLVEPFFYSHLDSMVEISEKYAFLAAQPKKNAELSISLSETRRTISNLAETLEKDLYDVLSKDIDHLQFELDVAKLSINKTIKK
ncbi:MULTISPECIES: 5-bromo-4-chloroindolyl phosphate hydrolysis family protein [Metabacillus]|uniref:Protein xpaC n=2 Tax=Metabacillus TaxID=2675233 RepID=A0A179T205_9BACI|nr:MULTISPECIES: 5-bromo-4-chloroindolyl phosphate hydrolysis family protein [Metabacillus]OAS87751.1 protein xpaC [Metabacillus litoralis]QNF27250.1 5-bromo-4-chloroindolyl phosphate hydrolysis family protein [Metabacillus sp. KUDC1714]